MVDIASTEVPVSIMLLAIITFPITTIITVTTADGESLLRQ